MALDRIFQKRKEEEEALIKQATIYSITSLENNKAATTAQEYSLEKLEQMRDTLKLKMQIHANDYKFLINSLQELSGDSIDTVCEAYFASDKTWYAALIQ